jgi:hypothetical protein
MPAAYSDDLRAKVVAAIDRGERKSHISQMFNISRDTLDRWLKRREMTGSVNAAQGYQQGHSHRIKDWQAFRAFRSNIWRSNPSRDGAIVAGTDQSTKHGTSIGTD